MTTRASDRAPHSCWVIVLLAAEAFGLYPAAVSARQITEITELNPAPASEGVVAPQQAGGANAPQQAGVRPPTPPHTGIRALLDGLKDDIAHLPSTPNFFLVLTGGGLAAAAAPFDSSINAHLRSHYDLVNDLYVPAKYYGDTPEQVGLSLGAYAFGRLFDKPKVSHLGMDLLRSQVISELLVQPLKFATHRRRPDGSNHQSFPSGHAAATFAGATIIERHLGWKRATVAYAVASYVATSRLHDNVHYLSDVLFGAALGSIAGRTVTQHGSDVWTLEPTPVPGGAMVVLVRTRKPDR